MELEYSKKRMTPPKLFCIYCPKGVGSFMTFESLQLHVQMAHGALLNGDHPARLSQGFGVLPGSHELPAFACELCTLKFTSVQALQKHTLMSHSFKDIDSDVETGLGGDTYCSQCKKSFPDNNSLMDHIRSVHENPGEETSVANGLNLRKSVSPQGVENNRKSTSPISSNSLRPRLQSPSQNKTFLCSQCNASFGEFESFRTHLKTHLDQSMRRQLFMCPECKSEFNSEEHLDNHVTTHYLSTTTEYGCQNCMKLFSKPDELQKHLMDIHSHHLHRCSLCRQVFDSKVGIQVHFAVKHSNECKLFKCNLCNSFFRSEMEFHLHVKVAHLHKAQPYRCLFCHLSYSSELELQYHLTTHKKQFCCKLCDEAFHVEFLLDKHVQIKHSPQSQAHRPQQLLSLETSAPSSIPNLPACSSYSREEAPKLFDSSTSEALDERLSDRNDVKCDICDAIFQSNSQLNSHRRQVHNITRSNSQTLSLHCAYCNESCKSRTELENHMKSHTATTSSKHKCNVCDELCPSATVLAEHKLQHCKVLTSSFCVTCKNQIRNEQQFYSHIQEHNGHGFPTPCVICRQTLTSEVEIRVHSKFHLKNFANQMKTCCRCKTEHESNLIYCDANDEDQERVFCRDCYLNDQSNAKSSPDEERVRNLRCHECGVKFETASDLEKHKFVHKKTYQCIKCQLSFDTEDEIQRHVTTHLMTEGSNHECQLCPSVFASPAKLQCHLIEHTFEGCSNFTCYMCTSVFTSSHAIQTHMLEHGLASRPYDCTQCHLKFFFRAELENHMIVHRPKYKTSDSQQSGTHSNFQCTECFKTFSTAFLLDGHVKEHGNLNGNHEEVPFPIRCSICPKSFTSAAELQNHYFTSHNDIEHSDPSKKKIFQCPECEKQFPCLSNLQGHMRIHTHGTRYTCTECSKEFALARNLNIHMRSHSGEKPYECPICQKRFARKENRKAHIKSHSGVKPFMCPHCGKYFSRKSHVKEHMKVHFNPSGNGSPVLSSCEVCFKAFASVQQLKIHLVDVHHRKDEDNDNELSNQEDDKMDVDGAESSPMMDRCDDELVEKETEDEAEDPSKSPDVNGLTNSDNLSGTELNDEELDVGDLCRINDKTGDSSMISTPVSP